MHLPVSCRQAMPASFVPTVYQNALPSQMQIHTFAPSNDQRFSHNCADNSGHFSDFLVSCRQELLRLQKTYTAFASLGPCFLRILTKGFADTRHREPPRNTPNRTFFLKPITPFGDAMTRPHASEIALDHESAAMAWCKFLWLHTYICIHMSAHKCILKVQWL